MQQAVRLAHLNQTSCRLTSATPYVEDSFTNMKRPLLLCAAGLLVTLPIVSVSAGPRPAPALADQKDIPTARITVEVTGGEKDVPVENASVYLKFKEEKKLKDKQHELNVKTNRDGIAHIPDAPLTHVLIQIVAEGWKTYGRYYDLTDGKEPIKIHLERPPKWY
jgi:hypothetical protein